MSYFSFSSFLSEYFSYVFCCCPPLLTVCFNLSLSLSVPLASSLHSYFTILSHTLNIVSWYYFNALYYMGITSTDFSFNCVRNFVLTFFCTLKSTTISKKLGWRNCNTFECILSKTITGLLCQSLKYRHDKKNNSSFKWSTC